MKHELQDGLRYFIVLFLGLVWLILCLARRLDLLVLLFTTLLVWLLFGFMIVLVSLGFGLDMCNCVG